MTNPNDNQSFTNRGANDPLMIKHQPDRIKEILSDLWTAGRLVGKAGATPEQWAEVTHAKTAIQALIDKRKPDITKVDRFEVIDETGRAYVKGSIYGSPVKIELSYQDGNRTLKVFVSAKHSSKDRDERPL